MISSFTFSILSFMQREGLQLQRNQLDLKHRRHRKQIVRLALEALPTGCFKQFLIGHQTCVGLIWKEETFSMFIASNISTCICPPPQLPSVFLLAHPSHTGRGNTWPSILMTDKNFFSWGQNRLWLWNRFINPCNFKQTQTAFIGGKWQCKRDSECT